MRPNLIFSLLSFAGSIALAILATWIHQYEGWFWAGAGFCVIAAIGIWLGPWASSWFVAYFGRRQQAKTPQRTKLIDVIEKARKAGWNMDAIQSNDASELTARLNQAAVDGIIKFWWRKYEYDLGETAVTNFHLLKSPQITSRNSLFSR
jgi:hypothetical protein